MQCSMVALKQTQRGKKRLLAAEFLVNSAVKRQETLNHVMYVKAALMGQWYSLKLSSLVLQ